MLAFIRDPFVTSYKWPDPVTLNALGMDNGLAPSSSEPCALGRLTQYTTALVLCDLRCAMLAFVRDPFMTSHAPHGPVPVDLLGMDNGPAMHPPCRPAQPSCACSVARVGLEACRSFHSRPVCGPI